MKPFISIIIPIFNAEKYIEKCILSIINQTYKNIEIICVNDCSTDNSANIINNLAKTDSRITVIHNKENIGVGKSRNTGFQYATGEYIHYLDSDDWIDTDLYLKLNNVLQNKDIDFLAFKHYTYLDEVKKIKSTEKVNTPYFNRLIEISETPECLYQVSQFAWDKLIKKDILNDIKFNNQVCHEDFEFSIRLFCKAKTVYLSNEYLIYHREHKASLSKKRLIYIDNIKNTTNLTQKIVKDTEYNLKNVLLNYIYIIFMIHYFDLYYSDNMSFAELKNIITKTIDMEIINKCNEHSYRYPHHILKLLLSTDSKIKFDIKYKFKRYLKELFPTYFKIYWKLKKLITFQDN